MIAETARKLWIAAVLVALAGGLNLSVRAEQGQEKAPAKKGGAKKEAAAPQIQMAILLDTSGSMTGLINQARTQLWKIVNEFATAKRDGKAPELQVGLYEYGKDSLPAKEGYMRMIVPLTDDLDKVSEELFKLTTNGGSEYCGQVIDLAVRELDWSESNKDLKCIFIAGNEPFTQGPIDYHQACRAAIAKNITVSTIHCGDHHVGVSTKWADGAKLADGSYMSINQNEAVASIAAPQDKELAELNVKLNRTYVAYGKKEIRERAASRQLAQDANAAKSAPGAAAARVKTKASQFYRNAAWDLLDAIKEGTVKLEDIEKEELPEEMQELKPEDRKAYLDEKSRQRKQIQARIKQLSEARDEYVAAERKKVATKGDKTLDAAIIESVRIQAERKAFRFEK